MQRPNVVISSLAWCVTFYVPVGAAVIYVDSNAAGQNNGSSWADAHTSLCAALSQSFSGDEVWVAKGTYAPIELKNGVKVYGGFSGTETVASASDPEAHKTYLSGGGVSRGVVSINNNWSAVLRGFYITDGFVDIPKAGGGLYLENSNATIVQCAFTGNSAKFAGGAVANYSGGLPTFVNCKFYLNGAVNNKPTPVGGGAVFNHDGAPTFVNCLFYRNKAGDGGAVVTLQWRSHFHQLHLCG